MVKFVKQRSESIGKLAEQINSAQSDKKNMESHIKNEKKTIHRLKPIVKAVSEYVINHYIEFKNQEITNEFYNDWKETLNRNRGINTRTIQITSYHSEMVALRREVNALARMLANKELPNKELKGKDLTDHLSNNLSMLTESFNTNQRKAITLIQLDDVKLRNRILLGRIKFTLEIFDNLSSTSSNDNLSLMDDLKSSYETLLSNVEQHDEKLTRLNLLFIKFACDINAIKTEFDKIANAIDEKRIENRFTVVEQLRDHIESLRRIEFDQWSDLIQNNPNLTILQADTTIDGLASSVNATVKELTDRLETLKTSHQKSIKYLNFKCVHRELETIKFKLNNLLKDGNNHQQNLTTVDDLRDTLSKMYVDIDVIQECRDVLWKYKTDLTAEIFDAYRKIDKSHKDGVKFGKECEKNLKLIEQTLQEFNGFAISATNFDIQTARIHTALLDAKELQENVDNCLQEGYELQRSSELNRINTNIHNNVTQLKKLHNTLKVNNETWFKRVTASTKLYRAFRLALGNMHTACALNSNQTVNEVTKLHHAVINAQNKFLLECTAHIRDFLDQDATEIEKTFNAKINQLNSIAAEQQPLNAALQNIKTQAKQLMTDLDKIISAFRIDLNQAQNLNNTLYSMEIIFDNRYSKLRQLENRMLKLNPCIEIKNDTSKEINDVLAKNLEFKKLIDAIKMFFKQYDEIKTCFLESMNKFQFGLEFESRLDSLTETFVQNQHDQITHQLAAIMFQNNALANLKAHGEILKSSHRCSADQIDSMTQTLKQLSKTMNEKYDERLKLLGNILTSLQNSKLEDDDSQPPPENDEYTPSQLHEMFEKQPHRFGKRLIIIDGCNVAFA